MGVNAHNFIDYGGVMAWSILTCSFCLPTLQHYLRLPGLGQYCSAPPHNTLSAGFFHCVSAICKLEHPIISEGTEVSVSLLCCTTQMCPPPVFTISVSPTFVFVWSLLLFVTHFVCADTHTVLTAIYLVVLANWNTIVSEGTEVSVSSHTRVVLTVVYPVALGALKVCLLMRH